MADDDQFTPAAAEDDIPDQQGPREPGDESQGSGTPVPSAKTPAERASDAAGEVEPKVFVNQKRQDIYAKTKTKRPVSASVDGGDSDDFATQVLQARMEMESQGLSEEDQHAALVDRFGDMDRVNEAMINSGLQGVSPASEPGDGEVDDSASGQPSSGSGSKPSQQAAKPSNKDGVDTHPGWTKILVNGQEQWATIAEVEEAGGVAALQKERAADEALQENRINQQRLERREQELARREREIAEAAQALASTTTLPQGGGSQGQSSAEDDLDRRVDQYTEALLSGDEKTTREAVRALLSPQPAPQPAPQPTVQPSAQPTSGSQPTLSPEQQEANWMFKRDYSDLASNQEAMAHVRKRIAFLQLDPDQQGRPLTDIVKEAGEYVRTRFMGPGEDANVLPAEEVQARIVRKKRIGGPSGATPSGQRNQTPEPPVTRTQRRHDAVKQMQRARGQG